MNVYLTFDIEIWCNSWQELDARFPAAFERYVYGRSAHGEFALPETLRILQRHGLRGVFFVEPLFAARFGLAPLREVVSLIQAAGQEVQLHLHPEWTDEALEPLLPQVTRKRQHLTHYDVDEQTALIGHGLRLLKEAGAEGVNAFRSGSFAANRDTYKALRRNGLRLDSSLNQCHAVSGPDLRDGTRFDQGSWIEDVWSLPVTVFEDGFGRLRPAQVGACGAAEMARALDDAERKGHSDFVIVSHNFEMLRAGQSLPDRVVVRRFEALCARLEQQARRLPVRTLGSGVTARPESAPPARPRAALGPTAWRALEQLRRRWP
jgi:hypothetical protein